MSNLENHELRELLKVEAGNPSPEELAAVIAVIEAVAAEAERATQGFERKLKSTWGKNSGNLRSQIIPGPGQWRGIYRSGLN
jgi:hypothetical protein